MKVRSFCFALCVLSFASSLSFALDDPEAKLSRAIKDYIVAKYPAWATLDARVTFKFADKIFESLKDLNGDVNFEIIEVYKDFKPVGNVVFPVRVTANTFDRKVFVRTKVEIFKDIVVAKRKINRGKIISAGDLALEKRDIAMLPPKYFDDLSLVDSLEAKTSVLKNSTIFDWMVGEIPLARRGDKVAIQVIGANVLLKSDGILLMDGSRGGRVKAKVAGTDKTIEGILVSQNLVEVKLK